MKASSFGLGLFLVGMVLAFSSPNFGAPLPQEKAKLGVSGEGLAFHWTGLAGRTYFVRTSSDCRDWNFVPAIMSGEGEFRYGLEPTSDHFFIQLVHTDENAWVEGVLNPEEADFDGDGLPNLHEIQNGLDPLDEETIDGIADGSGDLERDGRLDYTELGVTPFSHPSRVDNPRVKLAVRVLN